MQVKIEESILLLSQLQITNSPNSVVPLLVIGLPWQ